MTSSVWRTALVLVVSALAVPVAGLVVLLAELMLHGCCGADGSSEGDLEGFLLWLLAVGLLAAGPALGRLLLGARGVAGGVAGLALGVAGTVAAVHITGS